MSKRPFSDICTVIGNGDSDKGLDLVEQIASRLEQARIKHPVFAEGVYQGLGVIESEFNELVYAVEKETPARQHDECLDVLATAIRFANKEFE